MLAKYATSAQIADDNIPDESLLWLYIPDL